MRNARLLVVALVILVIGLTAVLLTKTRASVAKAVNIEYSSALRTYCTGSFREATNALVRSVSSTERSREKLTGYYFADTMAFNCRAHLAVMYAFAGEKESSCDELAAAYPIHQRLMQKNNQAVVAPEKFADFVFHAIEQMDFTCQPRWKAGRTMQDGELVDIGERFAVRFGGR